MKKSLIRRSKFLSLVLRHRPERIGITLDRAGWADIGELIRKASESGVSIDRNRVLEAVEKNDKGRFALSPDRRKIRAVQGHSIPVDLGLAPIEPPDLLYHGTATRFLNEIRKKGLKAQSRQYVHLSGDEKTAVTVGTRHGVPAVLRIDAGKMHDAGYAFYLAENGVWLTREVPVTFIDCIRNRQ